MGSQDEHSATGSAHRAGDLEARGLTIRMLGTFAVRRDNKTIEIPSRKARALLAVLICRSGEPISREALTGMLWGDRPDAQARASLRQALSELRSALADDAAAINATKEFVSWDQHAAMVDLDFISTRPAEDIETHEAALLSSGELLEGFSLDEPPFEQWLVLERERIRRLIGAALSERMKERLQTRDYAAALALGYKWLAFDPLQEPTHREIMRVLALTGRGDAALAQFERLKQDLSRELGVAPERETEALALQIRSSRRSKFAGASTGPSEDVRPEQDPRPSVAVLPFQDSTGTAEHRHFADGLTNDLIDALSRVGDLAVASREATSRYSSMPGHTESAARELGVSHTLEGNVRCAGSTLRVNARLISGASGHQIWSERYDGELQDIFAFQDEIARRIAVALQVELSRGDAARLWEGQTRNLRAWELAVRARVAFTRYTGADNAIARRLLEEAIAIDPTYTGAMAHLGICHYWDARYVLTADPVEALAAAKAQLAAIDGIDPTLGAANLLRAFLAFMNDQFDDAVALAGLAARQWPTDARAQGLHGMMHVYGGDIREARLALGEALRLSPYAESFMVYYLALAEFWAGRPAGALEHARRYQTLDPREPYGLAYEAIFQHACGGETDARRCIERIAQVAPAFGLRHLQRSERYRDAKRLHHVLSTLRSLGFAE